jgi:hypothetical protein
MEVDRGADLRADLLPKSQQERPRRARSKSSEGLSGPIRVNKSAPVPRTTSWNQMQRIANHVETTLLQEDGAPQTVGRTLPDALTTGASLRSTVFNLVSTMLGSGMLSLPWVIGRLGLGGGLTLMLLVPLLGSSTIQYVLAAADRAESARAGQAQAKTQAAQAEADAQAHTLPAVVEATLGRRSALSTAVCLILLNAGVLVSYCVVIKNLLPSQVSHSACADPARSFAPPCLSFALIARLSPHVPLTLCLSSRAFDRLPFTMCGARSCCCYAPWACS